MFYNGPLCAQATLYYTSTYFIKTKYQLCSYIMLLYVQVAMMILAMNQLEDMMMRDRLVDTMMLHHIVRVLPARMRYNSYTCSIISVIIEKFVAVHRIMSIT